MPQFDKTIIFFFFLAIIIFYVFYFFRFYIFEKINKNKFILGAFLILFFFRLFIETVLPKEYSSVTILLTLPFILFKNDFILRQKIFLCFSVILIFVTQLLFSLKIFSIMELLLIQIIFAFILLPYFLKLVHDVVKKVFFVKFFSFIWKILPWKADFTFCGISTAYLIAHFTCSKPVLLKALYAMCFVFLGYIENCEVNSYVIENSQEALNDEINDKTSGPENKTVSTLVTEKKTNIYLNYHCWFCCT